MSDLLGFVAVDRLTAWWWPVPPLVHVTQQLVPADKDVPGVALVPDDRLELTRAVYKLKATVQNICWHPTFQVCKDNVRIKHYEEKTHIGKLEGIPSRILWKDSSSLQVPQEDGLRHKYIQSDCPRQSCLRSGSNLEAARVSHK